MQKIRLYGLIRGEEWTKYGESPWLSRYTEYNKATIDGIFKPLR